VDGAAGGEGASRRVPRATTARRPNQAPYQDVDKDIAPGQVVDTSPRSASMVQSKTAAHNLELGNT